MVGKDSKLDKVAFTVVFISEGNQDAKTPGLGESSGGGTDNGIELQILVLVGEHVQQSGK